ncbi:MAG: DUF2281 domain-containing protein [Pyrinomonadaceae bacterium MAG19_C2-C3]|nr:DUF2281 domain-containing protein [Pyrinomonadaceae bacterium MAG19_C2-C3]
MSTNLADEVKSKMTMLPLEKQQQVLDFVEFVIQKNEAAPAPPRKSLRGDLAHLGSSVTSEDIEEARREMWRGYMEGDE